MCRDPMPRDVLAPADPDAGMPADVVEKTLEAGRSCGMADLPEVQPDRHHLGLRRALAIEDVEGIAAEGEEIVGGREDAAAELGVVVGESVGYHEMRPAAHRDPVGKLVVVGVAVVEEPAFLDQEAARVDAGRVAAIPADGTLTHGPWVSVPSAGIAATRPASTRAASWSRKAGSSTTATPTTTSFPTGSRWAAGRISWYPTLSPTTTPSSAAASSRPPTISSPSAAMPSTSSIARARRSPR